MEKGFNDDELADIMNEIESLEKEFTEDAESQPVESPAPVAEQEEVDANEEHIEPETVMAEQAEVEQVQEVSEVESEPIAEVHDEPVAEVHAEPVAEQQDSFEEEDFSDDIIDDRPILDEVDPLAQAPVAAVEEVSETIEHEEPVSEHEEFSTMEHTEVLNEVVSKPVEEVVQLNAHKVEAPTHTAMPSGSPAHSSMSFNIEGEMKLNLSFNISGKTVQLCVNDEGLELEMDGGMKFSIPLEGTYSTKKAA